MQMPPGVPEGNTQQDRNEPVETQLARYAFVREERDREVRLLFRDVPVPEIVKAFRMAGATLISISGERAKHRARGAKTQKPLAAADSVEGQTGTTDTVSQPYRE